MALGGAGVAFLVVTGTGGLVVGLTVVAGGCAGAGAGAGAGARRAPEVTDATNGRISSGKMPIVPMQSCLMTDLLD